jgi:CRP-like cAMP-binding protein
MFSLRSGQLKVSTFSPDGNELLLAIVQPGQIIGELGVLSTEARSATVTATVSSRGWALSRAVVMDFLEQRPAMAVAMLQQLADMVRRTTGVAADLVFLDLSHRMAKLLLERAGDLREIRATQAELASAIGASRQRVNGCLQEFQRQGWISLSSGSMRLLDPDSLRRVVLS